MLSIGLILFLAYAAVMAFLYFTQDGMLYLPVKEIEQTPANIGLAYEEVSFKTEDGVSLSAWYVPAENEKGAILFCHGNAGNISHRLDSINIFHSLGLSILIFDYRGYGKSEGRPSEKGTYLDAAAAWDYLVNVRNKLPGKIILFGRSLGGAVAAETALGKNPAGLILESGFTSVPDLGKKYYPWLPVRLLSKFRYSSIDKVASLTCPKLIIHSPEDELVPFEQGQALFKRASSPKEFLQITGGHNEGFLVSGNIYIEGLKKFLEKTL